MCRFVAYLGKPIIMDQVISKPVNSIIRQSRAAREMLEPVNGDGFGLGWYAHDIAEEPALFRSIQPAWNDLNLLNLASCIKSNCFAAHVRAASVGGVTKSNCHPFRHHQFLFMHNGNVGKFIHMKRHIRHQLPDQIYEWIQGETDSEHLYALFLNFLLQQPHQDSIDAVAYALKQAIKTLLEIQQTYAAGSHSTINILITDGKQMLGLRYVSHGDMQAKSLHYSVGREYLFKDGVAHMSCEEQSNPQAVLIASEKLTNFPEEWQTVPTNHFILVDKNLTVKLEHFDVV